MCILAYPKGALYEDVNRRTIEIPYCNHIFKASHCLKVYNAPLKLPLPISGYASGRRTTQILEFNIQNRKGTSSLCYLIIVQVPSLHSSTRPKRSNVQLAYIPKITIKSRKNVKCNLTKKVFWQSANRGDKGSWLHVNFWLHASWKMIAYESKMNIFEEMRYFLMFYANLGFIVCCTLVLLILSNFSFLSIEHSFSRTFIIFFGRNACLLCLKFIQTSYAILHKSMTENDCI